MKRSVGLILFLMMVSATIAAEGPADPRRTPAVEVFQRNKNAVVFLTGPEVGGRAGNTEEFFITSTMKIIHNVSSGFVIHESGYILSNAHAVERQLQHDVFLSDGKKYPAELLAVVRQQDMALLKIEAGRPLTPAHFARSDDVMVGEPAILIGNPRGLRQTCTTGVVSAVGRNLASDKLKGVSFHGLLQTDASINPGSSGGPWFNALGDVLGMTTCMQTNSENIGFGVPTATIREILPEMIDAERRQGFVTGLELRQQETCQVASVAPESPAAAAGIRPGDVPAKLDGKPLAGRLEYCFALLGHKAKDTLKLDLMRGDKPMAVSLVLAARPKPDGAAILKAKYGLTAIPLDDAKAKETALRIRRGVVISEVVKGKPWEYDKLQTPPLPGDVLARIDGIRPRDMDHVGQILDRARPGQIVNMVLLRRGGEKVTRVDMDVKTPQ
jgi:serine protease Do